MVNRINYLLVKEHLAYLEEVMQLSAASLRRYKFYLRPLLLWASESHLSKATSIQPAFPAYVSSLESNRNDGPLAAATRKKIIQTARRFFHWAKSVYPKQFGSLSANWIDSMHPPRTAQMGGEHVYVTLEEALKLAAYPVDENDLALRRDQAAVAMLFLSGMRATAFATLPIKAVDLKERSIKQWPEFGVKTKNGKRAMTFLLPIPELLVVAERWDVFVRGALSPEARWYAPIDSQWGEQNLSVARPGKNRSQALSKRLRVLYETVGLQYKSPHKFRHGHAVYGLQHAQTMADYKAVSMNLMHGDIKVTDEIYAPLLSDEVQQRINRLASQPAGQTEDKLVSFLANISDNELSSLMMIIAKRLASGSSHQGFGHR